MIAPTWITQHMNTPATFEIRQGEGAYGPVFGEPETVRCWVQEGTVLTRGMNGDTDVVSATRLWCLADEVGGPIVVGAHVDLPGRDQAEVSRVSVHDPGALPLPRLLEVEISG